MQPREALLSASREILDQAIAYHDRAMDIFDELDPPEDVFSFGVTGEAFDFEHLVALAEPAIGPEEESEIAQKSPRNPATKSPAMTLREIRELAGDDEPTRWVPLIQRALGGSEMSFDDLVRATGLRRVQVWMGCLLGGFELVPGADFYGADLVVRDVAFEVGEIASRSS